MKQFLRILSVVFAIALVAQYASAYYINFYNYSLDTDKEVTSEALMQQIKHDTNGNVKDKIKSVEVYNVGFGIDKNSSSTQNRLLLPYSDNYGAPAIRIHLNGSQYIYSITVFCGKENGTFFLNGAKMEKGTNYDEFKFSLTLNKSLSVIDIYCKKEFGMQSYQASISSINIQASSTDDKPNPSVGELTYSNFVRPLQGRVYVNPGQTLTAFSQNADIVKVLYENKEIASSTEGSVNFCPISSGKYTILASNSVGSAAPSEYDVVVSNTYPAYGSIVTSAETVEDGRYYLICGRSGNNSEAYLSLEPSKSCYCNFYNDMTNCFVRDSILVVKAVNEDEKWRFLTSDDNITGLCEKPLNSNSSITAPAIGEASHVDLEIVETGGFHLKMESGYIKFKNYGNVRIEGDKGARSTLLFTLDQTLPQGTNVDVKFEPKEVGDTTYAVGHVNITGLNMQTDDEYQLYCGGMLLGNLVDGSIDTYLPAADYGALTLVRKVNGYVQGVATLKQNPWAEICSEELTNSKTSNRRLHYDDERQTLEVYLPLELATDSSNSADAYSYTAEVKCDNYPNATIIEEDGLPVVYIPDYIENFKWDDRDNYTYDPLEIEVTPLFKVAEPQTAKSTAVDKTGYVRGKTTKLRYEFVNSEVSSINLIECDSFEAIYYTVDGRRITGTPTLPGIYIKRMGNEASKILIK